MDSRPELGPGSIIVFDNKIIGFLITDNKIVDFEGDYITRLTMLDDDLIHKSFKDLSIVEVYDSKYLTDCLNGVRVTSLIPVWKRGE